MATFYKQAKVSIDMIIIKGIEYGMVHGPLMIPNYCSVTIYGVASTFLLLLENKAQNIGASNNTMV